MSQATPERSQRKPTIRDVARHAGVSTGTVSNVLNGSTPVSDRRREAVIEAIGTLGFLPNGVAQSLRRRQSRVVGLIAQGTSSAYFSALFDCFEDVGARHGYEVMQVLSRGDPELELRRARALLGRQVDGVILVPTAHPAKTFDLIADAGVPAVIVDRASDDPRFDYVTMDNRAAMEAALRALVQAGRRHVLLVVGSPELTTTRARMASLQATGIDCGITTGTLVRAPGEAEFSDQIRAILAADDPPDTIVASNSAIALSLLGSLKALGARIPTDVSVLVFDDPVWATVMNPPLAVVRHPIEAIARSAWDLLIRRIEHDTPTRRSIVHSAEVVVRASIRGVP